MNQAEYKKLYAAAARMFPKVTRTALIKMQDAYTQATKEVAALLADAEMRNLSQLTIDSFRSLLQMLSKSQKTIADQLAFEQAVNQKIITYIPDWPIIDQRVYAASQALVTELTELVPGTVRAGNQIITDIHQNYLIDITGLSGGRITAAGLQNMFNGVNDFLVSSIANRIWQDGYTFSSRVWNAGLVYQDDIKRIVLSGLAQGRDVIEIAADLNVYVKSGSKGLIKRYGLLERGTAAFARRIRRYVYYPSLRIIRSELYASLQQNSVLMGQINPATNGLFDWIRANHEDFGCSCPDYAENSPYRLEDVPSYPHPNCLCRIQPRLRDTREFQEDLINWVNGAQVDYLDRWYQGYYLRAA